MYTPTSSERAKARRDAKKRRNGETFSDLGETVRMLGFAPQPTSRPICGYEAQRKLRWEPPKARR